MLKQIRREQQQQRNDECADDARQLRSRAGSLSHGGAGCAAADRKSLKQSGRQVGGAETDHLLIGIDLGTGFGRVGAGKHACVGK